MKYALRQQPQHMEGVTLC